MDGEKFKLMLAKEMYGNLPIKVRVVSEPEPYSKENKSKWVIVNWYRKWKGTYYESGYKYNVKIVKE